MVATLWAKQIMLGKRTAAQVPGQLKSRVARILEAEGYTQAK